MNIVVNLPEQRLDKENTIKKKHVYVSTKVRKSSKCKRLRRQVTQLEFKQKNLLLKIEKLHFYKEQLESMRQQLHDSIEESQIF